MICCRSFDFCAVNPLMMNTRSLSRNHPGSAVADQEILEGGGSEDNVTASSSFVANVHYEQYAFYTGKGDY